MMSTRSRVENDWKLFRKKLPKWQEQYIDQMNKEYQEILAQDKKHRIFSGNWKAEYGRIRKKQV